MRAEQKLFSRQGPGPVHTVQSEIQDEEDGGVGRPASSLRPRQVARVHRACLRTLGLVACFSRTFCWARGTYSQPASLAGG